MKNLLYYINESFNLQEALKINKNSKVKDMYKYHPKTKEELIPIIESLIDMNGWEADLNEIDTSEITDMSGLFDRNKTIYFNGDISNWDVSNVKNMKFMFHSSKFTGEHGEISNWNVSNVENMFGMFSQSKFKGDISKWKPTKVKNMAYMFYDCPLSKNPPKWFKHNL